MKPAVTALTPNQPGPGYKCKNCGQPGGEFASHWHQRCPMATQSDSTLRKRSAPDGLNLQGNEWQQAKRIAIGDVAPVPLTTSYFANPCGTLLPTALVAPVSSTQQVSLGPLPTALPVSMAPLTAPLTTPFTTAIEHTSTMSAPQQAIQYVYDMSDGQYKIQTMDPATSSFQYVIDPTTAQYILQPVGQGEAVQSYMYDYMAAIGPSTVTASNITALEDPLPRAPPGPGYKCKWCGCQGGLPESHWHQSCPNTGGAIATPHISAPPGAGYRCKWCGKQGGAPDSHWHNVCSLNPSNVDGAPPDVVAKIEPMFKPPPGVGYKCKWCMKPGGLPDSHWHNSCPINTVSTGNVLATASQPSDTFLPLAPGIAGPQGPGS